MNFKYKDDVDEIEDEIPEDRSGEYCDLDYPMETKTQYKYEEIPF